MWIGSDGAGLFRHKEGSFQAYTSSDGLPGDTVSSIISDAEGNLWMGCDNGVFSCSRKKLVEYEPGSGSDLTVLRLSVDDGLSSRGCSGSGQPVSSKSTDGTLRFPNMRGLAVFDPRAVTSGQRPPLSVLVESVVADGKELATAKTGEMRAPSATRRFEFHFTAPELA